MASLATIATIATIAGTATSALGQYQAGQAAASQAKSQQAMAEYNAKVQEQQAKMELAQSEFRGKRQAESAERQRSSLQAGLGASGVVPESGTPLLIQAAQAKESELDQALIGYQGQIAAARSMNQASLDRMQGSIYSRKAKNASQGGMFGAGTTLLSGFGRTFA